MAKKQGGKKRSIVVPVILCLLAVALVALNIAANMFDATIDHYAPGGGNPATVTHVAGSENWDSEYYHTDFRGRNQATMAAQDLVVEIEQEGIVLMKNDDNTLPLASGTKVTLLGRYAADPVYGGAGSGTVDPASCIDFLAGLQNANLNVNQAAYDFAAANLDKYAKAAITMDNPQTASYYIGEIPWADYPTEAKNSLAGTTAIVVLGRGGGEGGDLSTNMKASVDSGVSENFVPNSETANYTDGQHELELTREEMDLIAAAKQNCDKVVVVLNLSTSMELGPLVEEGGVYEADAIIEVGSIGATGATAVGQVLTGEVNPSGHTTDIWAADFTADPTFGNFGDFHYTDVSNFYGKDATFVEYREGIYYGYRYYETAAAEGFINYDEAVIYPFGYGLSYTTFEQKLDSVKVEGDNVVASVTVTNTGSVAGKTPVQIYYSAPYTKGGLEKSAVVLGSFDKTKLLGAGESQTLEISFPVRNMASWSMDEAVYVLDAGDYIISLRDNSHDVIAEETITLEAEKYTTDSATGNDLSAKFEDTTAYLNNSGGVMSRADFAGTFPKPAANKTIAEMGTEAKTFDATEAAAQYGDAEMPVTGASNGLSIIDMRGLDKDDELWDQLLDQLTVPEMVAVLNDGAYNTAEVPSISKPKTEDPDGPAGFTSLMGPTGNCSYNSEYVMAQTWNKELMYRMGEMIGQEALASGYNGWYAPAMNTHRSPFAGRNFEYYSEDPVLAGEIAASVVRGAASQGVYAYIKHFALNDQETNRVNNLMTWANEQTIREIYLKPFEYCVKADPVEMKYLVDGTITTREIPACTAVMSSFNFIGNEWSGGRKSLQTGVLRDEWGFKGFVITDFNLYEYMVVNQGIYAGSDQMLTIAAMKGDPQDTKSPQAVSSMRTAMHNLLYTVANSNAMNGMVPGTKITYGLAPWQIVLYAITGIGALGILFGLWRWFKGGTKSGDDGDGNVAAAIAGGTAAAAAGAAVASKTAAPAHAAKEATKDLKVEAEEADTKVKTDVKAVEAKVADDTKATQAKAVEDAKVVDTQATKTKVVADAKVVEATVAKDVKSAEADNDTAAKKTKASSTAKKASTSSKKTTTKKRPATTKKVEEPELEVEKAKDGADKSSKAAVKKTATRRTTKDAQDTPKKSAAAKSSKAKTTKAVEQQSDEVLEDVASAAKDVAGKAASSVSGIVGAGSQIIDRRLLGVAQGLNLDSKNVTEVIGTQLTKQLGGIDGIDLDDIGAAVTKKSSAKGVNLSDVIEILKDKLAGISGINLEEIIRALVEKAQELIG